MNALENKTLEELRETRVELWEVLDNRNTPDHVKQGAVALINYYGAEMDMRFAKGSEK